MALILSNLPLCYDIAIAKALSIAIVNTMSADNVEPACPSDIVRRISELT